MKPRYEIRVVDTQTAGRLVAAWPPGGETERDFVASVVADVRGRLPAVVEAVRSRGVGWFKGEAAVTLAVREALDGVVTSAVRDALDGALYALKVQVKP